MPRFQRTVVPYFLRCRNYETFDEFIEIFQEESKNYKHKFIDTHCHIDMIYRRQDLKAKTYSEFIQDHANSFPANYEGCVAIFCKPWTFIVKG